MHVVNIKLEDAEYDWLCAVAESQRRSVKSQAAYSLLAGLNGYDHLRPVTWYTADGKPIEAHNVMGKERTG